MVDEYTEIINGGTIYGRVYKITDQTNSKVYIGQTKISIYKRFNQHAKGNTTHGMIGKVIKLKGRKNFAIDLLDVTLTQDELDNREIYWIRKYDSFYPNGYNLNGGGKGTVVTEETRQRMREAHLGKTLSLEARRKVSAALRKRPRTLKTHCHRGHAYTPENTYFRPDNGYRLCITCGKENTRRYNQNRKGGD
ncbi:hypothetical protein LCGC14_1711220 [marine sediment metagenome]|uniref:GIY-YIG domain-containing protein n=1 Tax=marine sediment metagenome TaxID=412755 RepID=A0A0F9HFN6_9ZZZZ